MDTILEKLEKYEQVIPSYYNYYSHNTEKKGNILIINEEKISKARQHDAMAQATNVLQSVIKVCRNKMGRKTTDRISKETMCPIITYFKDEHNYKEDGFILYFILYLGTNGEEGTSSHSLRAVADILDEIEGAYVEQTLFDNADDVYDFLIGVPICVEKLKSED